MRKKDLPSAYANYLENLVQAGILKMDKKASAPVSLPEKLDEKILDFCERLRKANFSKMAQEIEENFVAYKGLSSKLEAAIRDNMVGENYPDSVQLQGLPEAATIYSPIAKQIETARKVLGEPLSKQADFIKTADFQDKVVDFAASPLGSLVKSLMNEFNTENLQSNVDEILENVMIVLSKVNNSQVHSDLTTKLNKIQQTSKIVEIAKGKVASTQSPSAESLKEAQLAVSMLQTVNGSVYGTYSSLVNLEKSLAQMNQSIPEMKVAKDNCIMLFNKIKKAVAMVSKVYWNISNSLKPQEPVSDGPISNFAKRKAAFASKFQDMTNWLKSMKMSDNQKIAEWANTTAGQYLEVLKNGSDKLVDDAKYADAFLAFESKVNQTYAVFQKYVNLAVSKPIAKQEQKFSPTGKPVTASIKNDNLAKIAANTTTNFIQSSNFVLGVAEELITSLVNGSDLKENNVSIKLLQNAKNLKEISELLKTANALAVQIVNEDNNSPSAIDSFGNSLTNLMNNGINKINNCINGVIAFKQKRDRINQANDLEDSFFTMDETPGRIKESLEKLQYIKKEVSKAYNRFYSIHLKAIEETKSKLKESGKTWDSPTSQDEPPMPQNREKYNLAVDSLASVSKQIESNLNKIYNSKNQDLIDWVSSKMAPKMSKINKDIDEAEKTSDGDLMNKAIEESNKVNSYLLKAINNFSIRG